MQLQLLLMLLLPMKMIGKSQLLLMLLQSMKMIKHYSYEDDTKITATADVTPAYEYI